MVLLITNYYTDIKYVTKEEVNEDKYGYAVCKCTIIGPDYGIQVPRKKHNDFVKFKCPRCGRKLGLFVRGTDPNCDYFNVY